MLTVTMQCLALAYLNGTNVFVGGRQDVHFVLKSGRPVTTKANENTETIRNLMCANHCLITGITAEMLNVRNEPTSKIFRRSAHEKRMRKYGTQKLRRTTTI